MIKHIRYEYLDILRGITLISMILYHGIWDLVYIVGVDWKWYRSPAAYVWQQSICITFILLAGFCWSLGRKKWKRGLLVLGGGVLVTVVTLLVTPSQRVVFGVLTLLGSCMLLMIPLEKVLRKIPAVVGLVAAVILFVVTRKVNDGYLGFETGLRFTLPQFLYEGGSVTTYLGFMEKGFFSTDYFSLIPWLFLFVAGYFGYCLAVAGKWMEAEALQKLHCPPLAFIGRHSLTIYLLHQPVLYVLLCMGK